MYETRTRTVIAEYDNVPSAQEAVNALVQQGVSPEAISLVFRDEDGRFADHMRTKSDAVTGGEGAGFGALIGLFTGLAISIGALTIPGIGPVIAVGPLIGGLVGGAAGAITGGITAELIKTGVNEPEAARYEEHIRTGGALVTVQTADVHARAIEEILNRFYPAEAENSSRTYGS